LQIAEWEVKQIGPKAKDPAILLAECRSALLDKVEDFKCMLTKIRMQFQEKINATESLLKQEWVQNKLSPNDFDCTFFQGNTAFIDCLGSISDWWRPITQEYLTKVQEIVESSMFQTLKDLTNVPKQLLWKIEDVWREFFLQNVIPEFRQSVEGALTKQRLFGTADFELTDRFHEECPHFNWANNS